MMVSFINIFRITAFLEGISYILLVFFATPIKYYFDNPQYVKILGMPHGILFMGYIALSFVLMRNLEWAPKQFGFVLLASIIPFGTFYIDRKYFKAKSQ